MAESDTLVAGLDGCRSGWVMATVPLGATGPLRLELVDDLRDVVGRIETGTLAAAAIDIPIGLATAAPRRCDVEARRLLGPRRSSVFPAPARSVLGAASYEEACARSALACGKRISRQLFNILPKIQQVDAVVTAATPGPALRDVPRAQLRPTRRCAHARQQEVGGGPERNAVLRSRPSLATSNRSTGGRRWARRPTTCSMR